MIAEQVSRGRAGVLDSELPLKLEELPSQAAKAIPIKSRIAIVQPKRFAFRRGRP